MVFLPSKKSLKVVYWSTGSQLLSEFAPLTGIEDSIVARGAGGSLFASAAADDTVFILWTTMPSWELWTTSFYEDCLLSTSSFSFSGWSE